MEAAFSEVATQVTCTLVNICDSNIHQTFAFMTMFSGWLKLVQLALNDKPEQMASFEVSSVTNDKLTLPSSPLCQR